MAVIISLKGAGHRRQVQITTDDGRKILLHASLAREMGLHTGSVITEQTIRQIQAEGTMEKCRETALSFLEFRPRSETEVRRHLQRRGYTEKTIDGVVARLGEQKLINDPVFAQFWRDNRVAFRPKSRRAVAVELLRKGVSREVATGATDDIDDDTAAYEAAKPKAVRLAALPYADFRSRLYGFLQRRGFDYDVAGRTVARLWKEL